MALLLIAGALSSAELPLHYWSGATRIDTAVSLDEVVVEDGGADQARLAVGGRQVAVLGNRRLRVTVGPSHDLATLDARAAQLGVGDRARAMILRGGRAGEPLVLTRTLVLGTAAGVDPASAAQAHGCRVVGPLSYAPDLWLLAPTDGSLVAALVAANALQESGSARFAMPLIERQHARRADPVGEPLFTSQWHLKNTGGGQVPGGVAGNDINVSPLWNFTTGANLGTGINVAVVDDGLERSHEDLSANARLDLGLNLNGAPGGASDPSPGPSNAHGTWTGGLIAARDNGLGGVGVAPRAKLIGVRLIAAATTEAQDGQALTYQSSDADATRRVHVSSNSWGPDDDVVDDPTLAASVIGPVRRAALESGITSGRGGKGIVYVWAAGNGRRLVDEDNDGFDDYGGDNLSYDGLASSRYVIAVGALGPDGTQASYSESGPALLVTAGGGDFDAGSAGIVTTDRTGSTSVAGNYTQISNAVVGTSFSTPIVSGVVSLMLEANPALSWRDVKHVLVRTSTQNDGGNASWQTNGAGHQHSVRYGFGRVNAAAAVAAAVPATWVLVPAETTPLTASETANQAIPDNNPTGISRTRSISAPAGFRAEYVELTVSATHTFRGDLHFRLTSPSGTVSDFERREVDYGDNLSSWVFTSAAHWDENPSGTWTLRVSDDVAQDTGTLDSWSLRIYGYLPHPAPTLSTVAPSRIAEDATDSVITCTGSGFVAGVTTVRWNGSDLATTVSSATQATAVVPAANLATAGTATVTVANDDFNGGATQVSSGLVVTIDARPTISVTPVSATTPEDTAVALTVTVGDSDTAIASLVVSATSANQALVANGDLVASGSGTSRTLTITPVPNATGAVAITVSVSDGVSSASQVVNLTITAVNDKPLALGGNFRTTPTGPALTGNLPGYDPEGATITFPSRTDPATGTLTVDATGAFTYTPAVGVSGLVSFTYVVNDGTQNSDPGTVFITVMGDPNGVRPLIISEPSDEILQSGDQFNYGVVTDTSRYLVAPTLTYQLVGAPAGMTIAANGVVTWSATGSVRHLSFGIVVKDSTASAGIDVQTVVLRIATAVAPN
jgi:subtilisin-like proprotein convertase family protein